MSDAPRDGGEPAAGLDLADVLALLPHGVVVVDPGWRVAYANPEAERLLGASRPAGAAVGATLWERCPALAQTAFEPGLRDAMADRSERQTDSALPGFGWCQLRARPAPASLGGGLLVTLRLISPHAVDTGQARQALLIGEIGDALTREESLPAAAARCADAIVRNLDAALVRVWTLDDAGALVLRAAAGVPRPGPVPARIVHIVRDRAPFLTNDVATDTSIGADAWTREHAVVAFAGYPLRIEDRIVGALAMYSRRPLDHDTLNALSSIASALSLGIERKGAALGRLRAEQRLREQADRLEQLVVLGAQLAAELDGEALVRQVADAATRLAGADAGALFYTRPGAPGYHYATGARDDLARLAIAHNAQLLSPTYVEKQVVRHADLGALGGGPPRIASYLAVPVTGRDARRLGALVVGHAQPGAFTAETERVLAGVAATAAIAIDNARLFGEARDLIAALETSNRELDEFAYVASHDLKAPLRGIANLATWIEDDLGERLEDHTRDHLRLLRGRVIRLENLIAGILAYSRAGRERGDRSELDAGALVRETWELLAPPPEATLVVGALPRLVASRVQLQQVLINLLGNAVKYNAGRPLRVEVAARPIAGGFEFLVRDDGVGIAAAFHDTIWGLFQTLERRDKIESTGIGLSVVRKIIHARGGRAWVESTAGAGATFRFTWPVGA